MRQRERYRRQSNFELLRIISMFLIVLHHTMVHGALTSSRTGEFLPPTKLALQDSNFITYGIANFLAFGGKVGVWIFVIISGYFMVNSKASIKKIVKLWLPVAFWSVFITILVGMNQNLGLREFILSFFPITVGRYWFVTTYVAMFILSPLFNLAINGMDKHWEQLTFILFCVIIVPAGRYFAGDVTNNLVTFAFAYMIGGIIRKEDLLSHRSFRRFSRALLITATIANLVVAFGVSYFGFKLHNSGLLNRASVLIIAEQLFVFFAALGIFALVGSKDIGYKPWINTTATATFGVYLIHDHNLLRNVIYYDIFHMQKMLADSPLLFLAKALVIAVIIYVVCTLLELLRKKLFIKIESKIVDSLTQAIEWVVAKWDQLFDWYVKRNEV